MLSLSHVPLHHNHQNPTEAKFGIESREAESQTSPGTDSAAVMSRPKIALVSLEKMPWFDDDQAALLSALRAIAEVTETTTLPDAITTFSKRGVDMPKAVLVTDSALLAFIQETTKCCACDATNGSLNRCVKCRSVAYCDRRCQKEHWDVHKKGCTTLADDQTPNLVSEAANYARAGGTVVFIGTFSSFSRPPDVNKLFAAFGQPWKSGSYTRTDHQVNTRMSRMSTQGLAAEYSQKALHLSNVGGEDAVYTPSSPLYSPSGSGQSPAVLGACGDGKVGYVGDVNNETETMHVILAMCGINAQ